VRVLFGDAGTAGGGEGVFVVEGGVVDSHKEVSLGQILQGALFYAAPGAVFLLVDPQGTKPFAAAHG
jgi:hypothetical protein